MSHYPNRRTFLESPHSFTRTPRTGQQNWSDLHQMRQDQFDAVRGILNAAILMGVVWAVIVAAVFAVVMVLG